MASLLPHSVGESKTQDQPGFKDWASRPHLLGVGSATYHPCFSDCPGMDIYDSVDLVKVVPFQMALVFSIW